MNKKYFMEALNDETLTEMIDKAINFEKTAENRKAKANLLKAIPAIAAMIAFVIGMVNIVAVLNRNIIDDGIPTDDFDFHAYASPPTTEPVYYQGNLFLPDTIEKEFFEERILAQITDAEVFDEFVAYYIFRNDELYVLDPNISEREKNILLEYLKEYTDVTLHDIVQMYIRNDIPFPKPPKREDPEYSHVRFGETDDILLLEVEWHTPESFAEYIEGYKANFERERNSEYYPELSEEEKRNWEKETEKALENVYKDLSLLEQGRLYIAKTINGQTTHLFSLLYPNKREADEDMPTRFDENGYYMWKVYPYTVYVVYTDENGESQQVFFELREGYAMMNKREYDHVLINQVIPFCDDLLERGLITQEQYDYYTIDEPVDRYIEQWFEE